MLRTTANVTGDATVALLINATEAEADARAAGDSTSSL
jgi:Na+/H+-dicarboxylate symporter